MSYTLTPAIAALVQELIKRPDVQSVSCPFEDEGIWRVLVDEQLRRAAGTGMHPQHAFGLSGPDSGLDFDPADWGGYGHIPFEGVCEGDLFIKPHWRGFMPPARAAQGATLTELNLGKACHHLLLRGSHPEVECATRTLIDGWTLYTSNRPYVPCSPFVGWTFQSDEEATWQTTRR